MTHPRHDAPYEAEPAPDWWPAAHTIDLIQGRYAALFPQLVKLLGKRRAAIAILEIVFNRVGK